MPKKKLRVDWHEATVCAIQIELRKYDVLLEYHTEYILGKNNYRIDLLVIQKLCHDPIPKNIANIFTTLNIFEIKGAHATLTTDAYYKAHGYAGHLIESIGSLNQFHRQDVSLSFITHNYPRKLFSHLIKDCEITVEKKFPGIYYIHKEMYATQIIVAKELSPEDNLYLNFLTRDLSDMALVQRLADDYKENLDNELYTRYLNQWSRANLPQKGGNRMVCEGLLMLCGTSSEEIAQKTREETEAIYLPRINQLEEEVSALKKLLAEHGIAT